MGSRHIDESDSQESHDLYRVIRNSCRIPLRQGDSRASHPTGKRASSEVRHNQSSANSARRGHDSVPSTRLTSKPLDVDPYNLTQPTYIGTSSELRHFLYGRPCGNQCADRSLLQPAFRLADGVGRRSPVTSRSGGQGSGRTALGGDLPGPIGHFRARPRAGAGHGKAPEIRGRIPGAGCGGSDGVSSWRSRRRCWSRPCGVGGRR